MLRATIDKTGRKKLLISGLLTEACASFRALSAAAMRMQATQHCGSASSCGIHGHGVVGEAADLGLEKLLGRARLRLLGGVR
jgi:hypothetical protein